MKDGYRMVVTSDHGEFLGEHQLLRHSGFLWEPGVKVPFVFFDSTRRRQPKLPKPFSTIHAYHLLRDGRLPDVMIPAHAVSEKNPDDILVGTIAGAIWSGGQKVMCVDGATSAYNLALDPDENDPQPLKDHAMAPALATLCDRVDALHELPPPKDDGGAMRDALRAMGYVEDDDGQDAPLPPVPMPMGGKQR
jgi:hypothetical protein